MSGRPWNPLVTIVTPTWNREALLEWTLRSVRRQTYRNIEHIVRDGGSTDGTLDLLRRYEGTYPMRWVSEPDAGMYSAVNAGLKTARGEILAYLNSDDLYFPWTVEVVVDAFRRDPQTDFVFGDALAINDETGQQNLYLMPPFSLDYMRRVGFLAQPAVFWRRAAYEEEGPFDESLRYVADCDYWMRAGARRRFAKVNEFLAIERNHADTLREAVGSPLWAELEGVRARYVSLTGPAHRRRLRLYGLRAKIWTRLQALVLLLQTFVPTPIRRGPWSRLLNARQTQVSRIRFFFRAIPWIGRLPRLRRAVHGQLLRSSRYWLEPPA